MTELDQMTYKNKILFDSIEKSKLIETIRKVANDESINQDCITFIFSSILTILSTFLTARESVNFLIICLKDTKASEKICTFLMKQRKRFALIPSERKKKCKAENSLKRR